MQLFAYVNQSWIRSWNQPVPTNKYLTTFIFVYNCLVYTHLF